MRLTSSIAALWLAAATLLAAGVSLAADPPPAEPGKPSPGSTQTIYVTLPDTTHRHARDAKPTLYLAWGAPWGTPNARDAASWACEDTTAVDTLYLSFDPGADYEVLMGIDATLVFHAAPGDTLGPFWDLSRKGVNPYNLRIEFERQPQGIPFPWPIPGVANLRYTVKGDAGTLDLTYYVQASRGGPIYAGYRYFFARVMIRMKKPYLSGCRQPVCVDFDHLLISHKEGSRWINSGQRFTSWNSPGGSVCTEYRKRPPSEEPMRFGGRYDLQQAPGETLPTQRDTTRKK